MKTLKNTLHTLLFLIVSITACAQMTPTNATYHIPKGSVIINMGITPQTDDNGLLPYGLVYNLVVNQGIPVIWSINPTKVKDGVDFSVDNTDFKGSAFIIEDQYATLPFVQTILNSETYSGVFKHTTLSDVAVPYYKTITSFTQWTFDTTKERDIVDTYLSMAGIPLTSRVISTPNELTSCHDVYVLPHADPTWANHNRLYEWVQAKSELNPKGNSGWLWVGCHAVDSKDGIENMYNSKNTTQRTNFLSSDNGTNKSVDSQQPSKTEKNWQYFYPNDVPMQFMGTVGTVLNNGSGPGYKLVNDAKWRPETKIGIKDPTVTPTAYELLYGYAYGNSSNGVVMYEAGHEWDGTSSANVAAIRIFLNFLFDGASNKQPDFTNISPELDEIILFEEETIDFNIIASGYADSYITYQWMQKDLNGVFSNMHIASVVYTAELLPAGVVEKRGTLSVTVTDPCGRKNVLTYPVIVKRKIKNYWHGTVDNDWAKIDNWTAYLVPLLGEDVEFATEANNGILGNGNRKGTAVRDLHLDKDRTIGDLINDSDVNLLVTVENKLVINGTVKDDNPNSGTIIVKTDANKPTGTLLFASPSENLSVNATVEFINKAYECATCGFYRKQWQYFGIPVQTSDFPYLIPKTEIVNQWIESYLGNKWLVAPYAPDTKLKAFKGYEITNSINVQSSHVYDFFGLLNVGDTFVPITKTPSVNYSGMNLIGNSFTAAIPISKDAIWFEDGLLDEETVYLFNTGTRDQWRKLDGSISTGTAGGQYQAVPFELAGQGGLPDRVLSMHTFMLNVKNSGIITLKYSDLVKNELINQLAWRYLKGAKSEIPYIVIDVIGDKSGDRVWLFEKERTTTGFDNGWDGYKLQEEDLIQIYVIGDEQSKFQIATVPQINEATFGVKAKINESFSINLSVSSDVETRKLFLHDLFTGRSYPIINNAEYVITASDNYNSNRFKIKSSSTLIDDKNKSSLVDVYVRNNIIVIDNHSNEDCIATVYELGGKIISKKNIPKNEVGEFAEIPQIRKGIYIVNICSGTKSICKADRVLLK